jgi:hypothetical protein
MIKKSSLKNNPEMDAIMGNIEKGNVNRRNALAESLEPKLRPAVVKPKGKKAPF